MSRDVTVRAPVAVPGVRDLESVKLHSPAEYTQELERQLQLANAELGRQKIALDTFTTIIAAFVKLASGIQGGGSRRAAELEVMLEKKVIDQMDGSKVTVSEAPGTRDVIVRIREGAPHPLWEGRHG